MNSERHREPLPERGETAWKWLLRALGVVGFAYLLAVNPDVPGYFYVLLGGLLGLPTAIAHQVRVNRERDRRGGRDA